MKTFVSIWYGDKIPWADKYFENCNNDGYKWLIFTDKDYTAQQNVEIVKMPFKEFLALYKKKIGLDLTFNQYGMKYYDLRPAFGVIFEDYLKDSEWWGHTDPDCVYGDLNKFVDLSGEIFTNDPYPTICGHFTLYKNNEKVNNLFREYPLWREMLSSEEVHVLTRPISGNLSPFSFTTKQLVDKGELDIKYDFDCQGNDKQNHRLEYDGNKLVMDGKEIAIFHFRQGKRWPLV